jgi:hypothetical protein
MELELKDLLMEKLTLELIKKIDQTDKESTIGQTEIITKVSSQMALDMVKVTSNKEKLVFNIVVNIKTIRNAVMER